MNKLAILILTLIVVSCSSTHEEVRVAAKAPSSEELETAKARLRIVRSDMPMNRVLDTLRLFRFKDCAKKCEGPTTLAVSFDLGGVRRRRAQSDAPYQVGQTLTRRLSGPAGVVFGQKPKTAGGTPALPSPV